MIPAFTSLPSIRLTILGSRVRCYLGGGWRRQAQLTSKLNGWKSYSWTFSRNYLSSISTHRSSGCSRCRASSAASGRKIIRLASEKLSAIGVLYDVREENVAFLEFSRHFRRHGLPVPEIYAEDLSQGAYLEEDLGRHHAL